MARILVVEDEPTIRTVLAEVLAIEGYDVTAVSDGGTAIENLRARLPDVVLLDLGLPVLSGREVVEQIRGEPAMQDVPVIVMTASEDAQAYPPPALYQRLIRKPFEFHDVLSALEAHL